MSEIVEPCKSRYVLRCSTSLEPDLRGPLLAAAWAAELAGQACFSTRTCIHLLLPRITRSECRTPRTASLQIGGGAFRSRRAAANAA